ncbi:MAG: SPOR domain-containing protein [Gammaproteobacteria bacterium]
MRNIFLILLLANLLLLGWLLWVDPEPSVSIRSAGVNELAIYGRADPPAASPAGDAASQCLYVGPIPDINAARQLSASLAERGIKVEPVAREGRIWLGHWVQIQGFATREQAESARQRLLAGGLPDAYVMQDGPLTIISLGVFREQGRAQRVVEAARRAGFEAVMRERVRAASEYWLAADQASGQQAALRDLVAAGFDRILRAETAPCPPATDSGAASVAPD